MLDIYNRNEWLYSCDRTDLPDDTPLQNATTTTQTTPSFAPVVIRIDYELENPRNGLIFVDPDEVVAPFVSRNTHLDHLKISSNHIHFSVTTIYIPLINRCLEQRVLGCHAWTGFMIDVLGRWSLLYRISWEHLLEITMAVETVTWVTMNILLWLYVVAKL